MCCAETARWDGGDGASTLVLPLESYLELGLLVGPESALLEPIAAEKPAAADMGGGRKIR